MRGLPPQKRRPTWREMIATGLVALVVVIPLRWALDPAWYLVVAVIALLIWAATLRVMTSR